MLLPCSFLIYMFFSKNEKPKLFIMVVLQMHARSDPDAMERLFYPKTVIEFIHDFLQINKSESVSVSVDELCSKFNEEMVISDICCPAYINSKTPHVCNRKTNFKNLYGLCNYHHSKFIQDGSMLIGKQKNIYTQIHEEDGHKSGLKECRHPKCKAEIEDGEYCPKHLEGNSILCSKLLKNGKKCRRFRTKDNKGNKQEYCKIHLGK
jgi:hypothetical protein